MAFNKNLMNRSAWAFSFFLFLLALLPSHSFSLPAGDVPAGFVFDKILFFEGGAELAPGAEDKFSESFPKSSTRYVYARVFVKNNLYKARDQQHKFVWKYFAEGQAAPVGEVSTDFLIKSEWYDAWVWHGWGQPGNWVPGRYRVEVLIDGIRAGENFFSVYDDANAAVEPQALNFYESGFESAPQGQRRLLKEFNSGETRYIYYQLTARNLLYQVRDQDVLFTARYLSSDGNLLGVVENNQHIPSTWDTADFWQGWGWNEPGHWAAGLYRVEVFCGERKLTEGSFSVVGGVPPVNTGMTDAKDAVPEVPKGKLRSKVFKTAVVEFTERGDFNVKDAGSIIAEWMTSSLNKTGVFEIYTRLSLQDVLKEQQFQKTDYIDEGSAAKAGKVCGVEAIVTGSVIKFGNTISVTVRLIDTETAKIIDTADIKVKDIDAVAASMDDLAWELARE